MFYITLLYFVEVLFYGIIFISYQFASVIDPVLMIVTFHSTSLLVGVVLAGVLLGLLSAAIGEGGGSVHVYNCV
jgi:hypothetical protein